MRYTFYTVEINLRESIENIYNNIDKKRRYDIRKAKEGGCIVADGTKEDFEKFSRLFKKYGYRPERLNSLVLFKETGKVMWYNNLPGKFLIAKKNNKIIAGCIFQEAGKSLVFSIASKLPEENYAESLLIWEAIKLAKSNGFEIFSFGAISPHARKNTKFYNVAGFKEKWGGKRVENYEEGNFFYIIAKIIWGKIKSLIGK